MVEYAVRGEELSIGSDTVRFRVPIYRDIEYGEFVVVLLETKRIDHEYKRRNVLAINEDGSIRWTISKQPPSNPRPYTGLYTRDGDLWTYNSSGYKFRIDPETGELLERKFVK